MANRATKMKELRKGRKPEPLAVTGFRGGGRGIRTPVTLPSNGFQDHRVMTASLFLRIYAITSAYQSIQLTAR